MRSDLLTRLGPKPLTPREMRVLADIKVLKEALQKQASPPINTHRD